MLKPRVSMSGNSNEKYATGISKAWLLAFGHRSQNGFEWFQFPKCAHDLGRIESILLGGNQAFYH